MPFACFGQAYMYEITHDRDITEKWVHTTGIDSKEIILSSPSCGITIRQSNTIKTSVAPFTNMVYL